MKWLTWLVFNGLVGFIYADSAFNLTPASNISDEVSVYITVYILVINLIYTLLMVSMLGVMDYLSKDNKILKSVYHNDTFLDMYMGIKFNLFIGVMFVGILLYGGSGWLALGYLFSMVFFVTGRFFDEMFQYHYKIKQKEVK